MDMSNYIARLIYIHLLVYSCNIRCEKSSCYIISKVNTRDQNWGCQYIASLPPLIPITFAAQNIVNIMSTRYALMQVPDISETTGHRRKRLQAELAAALFEVEIAPDPSQIVHSQKLCGEYTFWGQELEAKRVESW